MKTMPKGTVTICFGRESPLAGSIFYARHHVKWLLGEVGVYPLSPGTKTDEIATQRTKAGLGMLFLYLRTFKSISFEFVPFKTR